MQETEISREKTLGQGHNPFWVSISCKEAACHSKHLAQLRMSRLGVVMGVSIWGSGSIN